MALISAEKVGKRFGDRFVVRNLDLVVEPGMRLAVVGPNGSGKSTLLQLLSGELEPTEGQVHVDRSQCAYIGLESMLWPHSSVREHMELAGLLSESSDWEAAADQMQIGDVLNQKVGTLSTGFKHRVRLAMALAADSPVLLLDEPTAALDESGREAIRELMKSFDPSRAIVFATNNPDDIEWGTHRVSLAT